MPDILSGKIIRRLLRGEPQRVHIPIPPELADRAVSTITDDAWVKLNIKPDVPARMMIAGTCRGRAYHGSAQELIPCLVVTIVPKRVPMPIRNTWVDGTGGVR